MPPKDKAENFPEDAVLPLQDWLKLLSSRGVNMRVAMTLAAKAAQKLAEWIPDKDQRKSISNALRGLATGTTYTKKRGRDSDLLEPLKPELGPDIPMSYDFNEVLDPEKLIPLTVTVNRAPVKTAWTYVVARRLGFDPEESLSIAHVYVHISSLKHALMLGNILNPTETKEAEEELRELPGEGNVKGGTGSGSIGWEGRGWGRAGWKGKSKMDKEIIPIGSSQPWVGILRLKPVIERPDGTCRAIQQGVAVQPNVAYTYITRALKSSAGAVIGAMQLVAQSYTPEELNRIGSGLYNDFKPDVVEWGQRGTLSVAKILDQMASTPLPHTSSNQGPPSDKNDITPIDQESNDTTIDPTPPKKSRQGGKEAVKNDEEEEEEGGFLIAGDIV